MAPVVTCLACGTKNRLPVASSGRPQCASCRADLPWLVEVGDGDFRSAVEGSNLPVLVDVWAPWCGPCRIVGPVVEQLSRDLAGRLKVAKVNADLSPQVSRKLGIQSIPTLIMYAHGAEISRSIGAKPLAQRRHWVNTALESVKP